MGYRRTVSEYDGPEEGRAAHRTQALEAAARRYVPTETLTTRRPLEENGTLLHRWLGLGATQASAGALPRRASGQRRKRPGKKGLITEFLRPSRVSNSTSAVVPAPLPASVVDESILVDLSESLRASQSALGPYWGRSVSRKRDRPELEDLCQEEDSSEEEQPELGRQATTPALPVDRGYDSCDSEDLDSGFVRYREQNLAEQNWLGLRTPWPGWKLEAISTMRAYQVDFSSWVSGRRKWGIERRGPGRTKADRWREQLERETQGRHVQPVVLAEDLSAGRRRVHATGQVSDIEAASELGEDVLTQGTPKRRRTELLIGGARDRPGRAAVAPERVTGTAARGKRQRVHKSVVDAKRRRPLMERTVTTTDRPLRARPLIPPRRWKSRITLWMWVNNDIQTGNKCIVYGK